MADPLRIALVGCGALAEILSEHVYPQVRGTVRVVATIDVRRERAERLAQRLDAEPCASLEDACRRCDAQAVDIRLPHHLHAVGAELAADAQLPFLMEKPLAPSLVEARKIAALAEKLAPSCGVAENYEFLAPVQAARCLVADAAIGELLAVRATRVFNLGDEWRRDGWRMAPDGEAAGVIVDQATHTARMLRTVVGELAEVHAYAVTRSSAEAGPDSAAVALRFTSGVIGTQTYCWGCPTPASPDATPELSLYGSGGSIDVYVSYTGRGGGALLQRPDSADEWHGGDTNYYDSLAATLEDWADAVVARRAPRSSVSEGVRDVAVLDAMIASVRRGVPQAVPCSTAMGTA